MPASSPVASRPHGEPSLVLPRLNFRPPPGLEHLTVPPAAPVPPPPPPYRPSEAEADHCSARQHGRQITSSSECSTSNPSVSVADSEPTSPSASESLGDSGFLAVPTGAGGYVPGQILQSAIADGVKQPALQLRLESAVERPTTGTLECPSVGSAAHWHGFCKPCDFFHRGCCTNGPACKFCHLCGPEESKRRKKQKQAMLKATKRLQQNCKAAPAAGCPPDTLAAAKVLGTVAGQVAAATAVAQLSMQGFRGGA